MNKEEYIIKINDNEILVSKELYNILIPLGKIINQLQEENKQLKDNNKKILEYLDKQDRITTDMAIAMTVSQIREYIEMIIGGIYIEDLSSHNQDKCIFGYKGE